MSQSALPRSADPPATPALVPDEPSPIIAPEGRIIVLGFAIGAVAVSAASYFGLHVLGMERFAYPIIGLTILLTAWCAWFFRDPPRRIPDDPGAFISPADGVVCLIDRAPPPAELGMSPEPRARVCVFMNVINVHVNRVPAAGTVRAVVHRPGKFLNASLDKASADNERLSLHLHTEAGHDLAVVQIAGLVARRIVCRVKPGDTLGAGQRFGLIRFGSRVDLYLPDGAEVAVRVGQKTVAGETILACLQP
ncbi:MAG: hypothetical protein HBSAPP03_24640 [Phycisphaerae bacterium]|nr:MAG: hypothetical protein HBSAPP03_24640 [Phycisphaerae bacterium]